MWSQVLPNGKFLFTWRENEVKFKLLKLFHQKTMMEPIHATYFVLVQKF